MRTPLILTLFVPLAACAVQQEVQFIPSAKPATELRAVQTRMVPGDTETVMRGVIATLHDLGYRITKVEAGAGTVSGTRQTALRMAVVVRPRTPTESIVRANATIVAVMREAQVDAPAFYRDNFFVPLGATLHRTVAEVTGDVAAPDAVRPAVELNSIKQREAAAKGTQASSTTPLTGAKSQ